MFLAWWGCVRSHSDGNVEVEAALLVFGLAGSPEANHDSKTGQISGCEGASAHDDATPAVLIPTRLHSAHDRDLRRPGWMTDEMADGAVQDGIAPQRFQFNPAYFPRLRVAVKHVGQRGEPWSHGSTGLKRLVLSSESPEQFEGAAAQP